MEELPTVRSWYADFPSFRLTASLAWRVGKEGLVTSAHGQFSASEYLHYLSVLGKESNPGGGIAVMRWSKCNAHYRSKKRIA